MKLKGKAPDRALAKWRERHPEVDAWVNQQLEEEFSRLKPRLLRRFERFAMMGSVPHAEFIAKVAGWLRDVPPPAGREGEHGAQLNAGFVFHIHR